MFKILNRYLFYKTKMEKIEMLEYTIDAFKESVLTRLKDCDDDIVIDELITQLGTIVIVLNTF